MLFCQQLRGGHQRRLTAVFDAEIHAGGGHHGLTGADISLTETVHGLAALHIGNGFLYTAALGVGEGKGEGVVKRGHIHRLKRFHGDGLPPGAQQLQSNGEEK